MRILKLLIISSLFLVLFIGCKKQKYPDHIIAGEIGRHIYYSGSLNIEVSPNTWTNYHEWEIDINNDGTTDCILEYYAGVSLGSETYQISIKPDGTQNCAIVISNTGGSLVDTIPPNTPIDDNKQWYPGNCILYHYHHDPSTTSEYGLWNGVKNKYVGVRARDGDRNIYGWLRLEINGSNLKFIDYAGTGY